MLIGKGAVMQINKLLFFFDRLIALFVNSFKNNYPPLSATTNYGKKHWSANCSLVNMFKSSDSIFFRKNSLSLGSESKIFVETFPLKHVYPLSIYLCNKLNFAVATTIIFADCLWKVVLILFSLLNKKQKNFRPSKFILKETIVSINKRTVALNLPQAFQYLFF